MRTTAPKLSTLSATLLATVLAAGCVGNVGGGDAARGRGQGSNVENAAGDGDCAEPQKLTTAVTIRSQADFDKLPKACWDLWAKLRIEGPAVTSLAPLGKLVAVDSIELVDTNLATIDTVQPLEVYGSITVTGNTKLTTLQGLVAESWEDVVPATVAVRNNPLLADLAGLRYLRDVAGPVAITDNAALTTVALAELATATDITIANNAKLNMINLNALTSARRLEVATNALLSTLSASAATDLTDLALRANPALATVSLATGLTALKGSLTIDDNDALATVGSLTTLQTVAAAVTVTNNALLADITPLNHLRGIGGLATITGNPALSNCQAIQVSHCVPNAQVTFSNNKTNTGNDCATCWCGR